MKTPDAEGVHVVFGYDYGQGMEIYDKVVVTDPKRTRLHLLLVHCAQRCYDERRAEISHVTGSFTVKDAP